jgi:hypothetical protein
MRYGDNRLQGVLKYPGLARQVSLQQSFCRLALQAA